MSFLLLSVSSVNSVVKIIAITMDHGIHGTHEKELRERCRGGGAAMVFVLFRVFGVVRGSSPVGTTLITSHINLTV